MAVALDRRELSISWLDGTRKRRLILLTAFVIAVSLAVARLVLSIEIGALTGLAVWAALAAVVYRPRYGVYMLFLLVLVFEPGSADPMMLPGLYLHNSIQGSLHINGAILMPMEMLLLLASGLWLAQAAMRHKLQFQSGSLGLPMLLFGAMLLFGIMRGLAGGGIFNYAFWESRFLVAMVLTYILAVNTIRTKAHVRILTTIIMLGVGFSSIEGVWRKFALADAGLLGPAKEVWYSHDNTVTWAMLIMLVLAQMVFGGPRWQRMIGPWLLLITAFTMLVSERRAAYIAVILAFIAFSMVLFVTKRRAFMIMVVPVLIASAVYLPMFWNNTGTLGQPARALRSISAPDPRDAMSNAWRDLEAINVRATIASDPILGIGFGRPFLQIVTVPDISFFEFWNYESHHNILWVWMKTGAFGFTLFFFIVTSAIARGVWLARTLKDPELRTLAIVAMSAVMTTCIFCYVDLGLTGSRIPISLGVMLGALGVLDRVRDKPSPSGLMFEKRKPS
jgi:hypothetical protein